MIPPLAIPCRVCLAGPGTICAFIYPSDGALPPTRVLDADGVETHPTRVSDTELAVAYLVKVGEDQARAAQRAAASPAVVVRAKPTEPTMGDE